MKKETTYKEHAIKGSAVTLLTIGLVVGMLIVSNSSPVPEEIVEKTIKIRQWHEDILIPVGEADPGAGNSGVLGVWIYAHQGDPGTAYATNLSESGATVYAFGDVNNSHIGSIVPYNTAFDIVVKVRWNQTHAFNASSNTWMHDWVRGNITCAAFSLSDEAMTEQNITDATLGPDATYIWMNYYWNNAAAGGTISRGQNVTSCSFTFDAYY